eukprot:g16134.t1
MTVDELTVPVDLTPFEAEHYIESGIEPLDLERVGDKAFLDQHEKVDNYGSKKCIAEDKTDEFVVDLLNTHEKVPVLIHNLITIETWKEYVYCGKGKQGAGTSSSSSCKSSSSGTAGSSSTGAPSPSSPSSASRNAATDDAFGFKNHVSGLSSLRSYIPVYAEASLVSLVEMCLYHSQSCETGGEALVDLIDYVYRKLTYAKGPVHVVDQVHLNLKVPWKLCKAATFKGKKKTVDLIDYVYRKLTYLVQHPNAKLYSQPPSSAQEAMAKTEVEILNEQYLDCEFQICMSALNICRYLTDHRQHLPLTLTTRLLDNHDILLTLVPLMEKAPWIEEDDLCTLPKLSSQLWLTIYNLTMDPSCRNRYEMRSHRKDNLLRLRRFLNEIVFDQIPPLVELLRTLEELSITGHYTQMAQPTLPGQKADPGSISSAFFVELVAEVREALLQTYRGRWGTIADRQMAEIFVKESPEEMKRLQDMICLPRLEGEDEELSTARQDLEESLGGKSMEEWIAEVGKDLDEGKKTDREAGARSSGAEAPSAAKQPGGAPGGEKGGGEQAKKDDAQAAAPESAKRVAEGRASSGGAAVGGVDVCEDIDEMD